MTDVNPKSHRKLKVSEKDMISLDWRRLQKRREKETARELFDRILGSLEKNWFAPVCTQEHFCTKFSYKNMSLAVRNKLAKFATRYMHGGFSTAALYQEAKDIEKLLTMNGIL